MSVASSRGVVAVSRADGEISPEDVKRAVTAAQSFLPRQPNREVIHMIPRDFKVDNESGVKDPVASKVRAEAKLASLYAGETSMKATREDQQVAFGRQAMAVAAVETGLRALCRSKSKKAA